MRPEGTDPVATLLVAVIALIVLLDDERERSLHRNRIAWRHHSQLLLNEGQFRRYYRMGYSSFERLVSLLAPALIVDEAQSRRRAGTDPVSPVNKVQACISYLAGYPSLPARTLSGVASTTFYNSMYEVMDAIRAHPDLQLRFSMSAADQRRAAHDFNSISSNRVMCGCIGAIDGWLCRIQTPWHTDVGRVRSFFSGHYHCYGINVQACCDHLSRFTAMSCSSPGVMGDAVAYLSWGLSSIAQRFPPGLYLVGDNAYSNNGSLLIPFTRPQTTSASRDSFNFHLSQLRIRIEMAFGLLVNKWRAFKSPLMVRVKNDKKIIHTAFILHNWCINERLHQGEIVEDDEDLLDALDAVNDGSNIGGDASQYSRLYAASEARGQAAPDDEVLRNMIVTHINNSNIQRPQYDQLRSA